MASTIDRTWVGGLSSGLDTQSMITKLMQIERLPVDRLEQKRNTLDYQKSMLQEVNLRLFDLQSRATDLTFSRTFKSKAVSASNERAVSAVASTEANVGVHTVRVKQLATNSVASSAFRLAAPLEQGHRVASTAAVGGENLTLDALGVVPGDLKVTISGGTTQTLDLNLTGASTVKEFITAANSQIQGNSELRGKLTASFDQATNQVKFTLLDTAKSTTVTEAGDGGTLVTKLFAPAGVFILNKNTPTQSSDPALTTIRSGLATTLEDLGVTVGDLTLTRVGGTAQTLDLTGLTSGSTVGDLVRKLNEEIGSKAALTKSGTEGGTGNPSDRLLEFRFDEASGKVQVVNTNSGDPVGFTVANGTSNLGTKLFGGTGTSWTSTMDEGKKLSEETLTTAVTGGTFTIAGQRISVDPSQDTLQHILSRINSQTNLTAAYDSRSDTLRITRNDGLSEPIGMGSAADTSNFLTALGLIGGSQQAAAVKTSSGTLTTTADQARGVGGATLTSLFGQSPAAGSVRVTVGGVEKDVAYTGGETLNEFLAKIQDLEGVAEAYYDASTGKINISTDQKGTEASLKLEDLSGGNLLSKLNLSDAAVAGTAVGSVLESRAGISGVQTSTALDKAGFATDVTAGSFTINGVRFSIGNVASMTMDSVLSAINSNATVGVRAEYNQANGKILLTSLRPGNTGVAIGAAGDTSNFLTAAGLTKGSLEVGQNAVFSVDGMFGGADIVRQENTISDVIDGVTLTLKEVTGTNGETITVSADTEYARTKIDEFITAYNSAMDLIYNRLTEKRDRTVTALSDEQLNSLSAADRESYEMLFKTGLLAGDSTLSTVRSRMRITMSTVVSGLDSVMNSLSDIGISTGVVGSDYQSTQVGNLQITDSEKLTTALRDNPNLVADLFAKDVAAESGQGIARRLKDTLNEFTKTNGILTQRVGRSGIAASSAMGKQITLLNTQIAKQEVRLQSKEEALLQQFANLEKAMSTYQSQSAAFAQQMAQLG